MLEHDAPWWKVGLAFGAIYFIWGSTFFAIRVGVLAVPPLVFAAMRFFAAGALLFGWKMLRRATLPTVREWKGIAVLAALVFVGNYGLLFWAEARVPSGVASVVISLIALFIALGEVLVLRTRVMTARLALALLIGIAGVAVLSLRFNASEPVVLTASGAIALLLSGMFFASGAILSRKLTLPADKAVSSGAQMLLGGAMLVGVAFACGETRGLSPSQWHADVWWAWAYLVFAGSIAGFTAYVWLLARESPTKVGTYSFVNPCVAVLLGHFAGGEPLGWKAAAGATCIVASVVLITTAPRRA